MAFHNSGKISTNGLVLCLDAGNPRSYVSGSTNWFDLSGNNNSGSLLNGPVYTGSNGGAIVFDGVNDYSRISAISAPTQFTLNFWLNPIQTGSTGATELMGIINNFNGLNTGVNAGFTNRLFLSSSFSQLYLQLDVSGVRNTITSSVFSSIQNKNSMCTVTYNTNAITFYVNGAVVNSSSFSGTIDVGAGTSNPTIGWGAANQNYYYNGVVYAAYAYNRALSAQEVKNNYDAVKSRYGLT